MTYYEIMDALKERGYLGTINMAEQVVDKVMRIRNPQGYTSTMHYAAKKREAQQAIAEQATLLAGTGPVERQSAAYIIPAIASDDVGSIVTWVGWALSEQIQEKINE